MVIPLVLLQFPLAGLQNDTAVAQAGQVVDVGQPQQFGFHALALGHIDAGAENADDFTVEVFQDIADPGDHPALTAASHDFHFHRQIAGVQLPRRQLLKAATNRSSVLRGHDGFEPVLADQIFFNVTQDFSAPMIQHRDPAGQIEGHQ